MMAQMDIMCKCVKSTYDSLQLGEACTLSAQLGGPSSLHKFQGMPFSADIDIDTGGSLRWR